MVDCYNATQKQQVLALGKSNRGIISLLEMGIANGGMFLGAPFQNFPPDVVNLLAYLVAHEGHHRGQLVLLARQLGHRLPENITAGLWQWSKRAKEW